MTQPKTVVKISIVSDFICPWCRIGEKRLENAIAQLPDNIEVELRWLPYELNPQMPKEGMNRDIYRAIKFGSWQKSQMLDAGTIEAGAPDGVKFDYDKIRFTPNTFSAHKLTYWADLQGKQSDVAHRILKAYFLDGRDIGDTTVLAKIAEEAGLDAEKAKQFLADVETDAIVEELLNQIVIAGVAGVPQFDIEGTIVRGAQSAETLADAILTAAKDKKTSELKIA